MIRQDQHQLLDRYILNLLENEAASNIEVLAINENFIDNMG